jgi:uncharacterized delta-60 repeat protein
MILNSNLTQKNWLTAAVMAGAFMFGAPAFAGYGAAYVLCQADSDGDSIGFGATRCSATNVMWGWQCTSSETMVWSGSGGPIHNCSTGFNEYDNCPYVRNANQTDTDGDGVGDVCQGDLDGDTVLDANDNCRINANTDQLNTDGDAQGNVCDADDDNDGVPDTADTFPLDNTQAGDIDTDGVNGFVDNCPANANADQLNTDGDAEGNECDADDDNDGVRDAADRLPLDATETMDSDYDGIGNNADTDDDNDSVLDAGDNCPLNANANQLDTDGDALGNVCDSDDDNDGVLDAADKFPLDSSETLDLDNDGLGNNADTDDDNDGLLDASDNCPLVANADQLNTDGDAQGNACDSDQDNDGVLNNYDDLPLNAAASLDTDRDGFPNSWNATCDATCQANSGLTLDNCPSIASTDLRDLDGDGTGNVCDSDDDNDGVLDVSDNCPFNNNPDQLDTDLDSMGDVCDAEPTVPNAGLPDSSFNAGIGANNFVDTVVVQPDGKLLIGGNFTSINGVSRGYIARLYSDGSLDSGFNSTLNNRVNSMALQADGKLFISGTYIARLNGDGSRDGSFNRQIGYQEYIYSVVAQADGKLLVSGKFYMEGGRNGLARLNSDGSLDTGYAPNIIGSSVSKMVQQANGKLLIFGDFDLVNNVARNHLARLNSNGSLDHSFNAGVVPYSVYAMAEQADGKLFIGGNFTNINGVAHNGIARLNSNGSLDTSFNSASGANGSVKSMALQADGKLLIGGNFTSINGVARNGIARLNSDGALDTSFNPGTGAGLVNAMALQADGKLFIGGFFRSYNTTVLVGNIARIHTGDADQDGVEDAADFDFDNDGSVNSQDAFPFDAAESLDTDHDGIGNNADPDDDNDGLPDVMDPLPLQVNFNLNAPYKGSVIQERSLQQ